jgi:hypothetical protein
LRRLRTDENPYFLLPSLRSRAAPTTSFFRRARFAALSIDGLTSLTLLFSPLSSLLLQELADSALAAFLKALVDMDNANTNGTLSMYLVHNRVVKRFGTNFRIKMGFGMHVGWAIEGAIGSSYKIDATYMSPHVEMSDRLEAGSKIFGVPINISHWLYALLSPKARKFLRPIDRILVEGCPTPMTVYTYVWVGSERSSMRAEQHASGAAYERRSMRAEQHASEASTKGGSRWCAARRKEVTAREKEEGRWAALALFCAR